MQQEPWMNQLVVTAVVASIYRAAQAGTSSDIDVC